MRARVGYVCLAFAVGFGCVAVVSMHYAIPATIGAVLFGGLSVGLLAPGEPGPNPRTADLDPLTASVNRAYNTGEMVVWNEGDPVPDPAGPVRELSNEMWVGWDG